MDDDPIEFSDSDGDAKDDSVLTQQVQKPQQVQVQVHKPSLLQKPPRQQRRKKLKSILLRHPLSFVKK